MKSARLVTIFLVFILSINANYHPFHASITECAYDEQNKSLEITMRLFTDDLGHAIGEEISTEKRTY